MTSSTVQASQGIVAATESSSNGQNEGINFFETISQGNNEATAPDGEDFNDSGYFGDDNYKDFQLYQDDLPEIDPDTDRFFADADASVQAYVGSLYHGSNDSGVNFFNEHHPVSQLAAVEDDAVSFNAIHEVNVAAVSEVVYGSIKDYDIRSQAADSSAPPSPEEDLDVDPLLVWVGTRLRHEQIAYRLLQEAQPVRESEA